MNIRVKEYYYGGGEFGGRISRITWREEDYFLGSVALLDYRAEDWYSKMIFSTTAELVILLA